MAAHATEPTKARPNGLWPRLERMLDRAESAPIGWTVPAWTLVVLLATRLVVAYTWFWGARTKHPWLDPPFGWLGGWLETERMHNPIPGYPWLVEHVLQPNLALVGWTGFLMESYLAVVLALGLFVRFNGWLSALWGLNIAIGNLGAPREPVWSLLPLFLLPLLIAEARAGRAWGVDAVLRRRWLGHDNKLLRALARHGM